MYIGYYQAHFHLSSILAKVSLLHLNLIMKREERTEEKGQLCNEDI